MKDENSRDFAQQRAVIRRSERSEEKQPLGYFSEQVNGGAQRYLPSSAKKN